MENDIEKKNNNKRSVNKSISLKVFNRFPSNNKNLILNKSESESIKVKYEDCKENKTLLMQNKNILNIISNCMEKIKDEKQTEDSMIYLNNLVDKKNLVTENKKRSKKQVMFKENEDINLQRSQTKKLITKINSIKKFKKNNTLRTNNGKSISKHLISEHYSDTNINKKNNNNKNFNRISTVSKFAKEKEKEIVQNISTSLISLYKPKKEKSKSNFKKMKFADKNKLKNLQRNSLNFSKFNIKRNISLRRNSKDECFNSNLSNDNTNIKKGKKFKTFIKLNKRKNKFKVHKMKERHSYQINENHGESFLLSIANTSFRNFHTNLNEGKKNRKNSIEIFKNREDLTEDDYAYIGNDLKQTLIVYEKTRLEEELKNYNKTETTALIQRLPTMKMRRSNQSNNSNDLLGNGTLININLNDSKIKVDKEKFRILQHTGYVYDSLDDEEFEDAIDINNYYISPDSIYLYIFDSVIVILSIYNIFYLPYYLAQDSFLISTYFNIKVLLFHIIDIFFIIDLLISFFRSYYNYDEQLVNNVISMSLHYINNWFLFDFIAAIPFFSIFFYLEYREEYNDNIKYFNNYYGIKINKIHYLLLMNKLIKIFKCISDTNRAMMKVKHFFFKYNIMEEKSGIIFVIFILLVSCNLGTCLFIFIGRNSYPSWLNTIKIKDESFTKIYICSLYYFITTITTVGYGDIYGKTIIEIIFQIILLIVGTCTYSYLISSVSNFIKKINEKSLNFENKLKVLNDIRLTNPHLQDGLYEKVLRFLRYKKGKEKNQQKILINSLPYSLKNNLIIEMYKPIINNFIIFKGLENSNCIVQLVTAFKPIYLIKNDILYQEGDFVDEVIFVKTGVIGLEIGIDLNDPKKSIVEYLNRLDDKGKPPMEAKTKIFDSTMKTLSTTSSFLNQRKTTTIKNEEKEDKNKHYLKVLDIRRNEHFGETLVFLNERSFLTAKVKSKKAELFFLNKEEIIKIFSTFQNIWNRINKKSIYNMKQIKITVRKVLLSFCSMCGINISDDYEKDKKKRKSSILRSLNRNKKQKKKTIENEKKEEKNNLGKNHTKDFGLLISQSIKKLKQDKKQNNNNEKEDFKSFNSKEIISDTTNNNHIYSKDVVQSTNELLSSNARESLNLISINSKNNNNSSRNNLIQINEIPHKKITSGFSNLKKMKKNIQKEFEKSDNKKKEMSLDKNKNKENNSHETIKVSLNKKICSLIDSESLEDKFENESEDFNVNDEIYSNESFNLKSYFDSLKNINKIKSNINNINNHNRIENLSKKILEKTWIENLDKEKILYLEDILNKSTEYNNTFTKKLKIGTQTENDFHSSSTISMQLKEIYNESFIIKASYENINEITNHKYIKNKCLRNKTKNFLIKESFHNIGSDKKMSESKISSDYNLIKSLISEKKLSLKKTTKTKRYDSENMNKTGIILKKKRFNSRNSLTNIPNYNFLYNFSLKNKNVDRKRQGLNITNHSLTSKHKSNLLLPQFRNHKKFRLSVKNNRDKLNKTTILNEENDISFYDKYNIINNSNAHEFSEKQQSLKKKKKQDSDYEEIKHIIKQDAQNLNQPSLYYQNLFLNQIQQIKNIP